MTEPIKVPTQETYVTWGEGDERARALAVSQANIASKRIEPVIRTHGSSMFLNVAPNNVSVRSPFNRNDYEDFRRGDALPTDPKEIIRACMDAYDNVGIIRNVVDLMGDFATQGIDLNHPNERIEKWYKEWFRRIGGKERSERFLNLFYRTGNVIVQRHTAILPVQTYREMNRAKAEPDMEVKDSPPMRKREIPWKYTFRNPLTTEVISDDLGLFVGTEGFLYGIRVPKTIVGKIVNPQTPEEKAIVKRLPDYVKQTLTKGGNYVPLDPEKVRGFYYKRDDWQKWAKPMVSAILSDLQLLQKMKLADMAALDGAISCIRVWKLGSLEHRIMPTEAGMARLAEILANNVGGGVMDFVWGPELSLLETSTDVHQFLGETKYASTLAQIYAGLGIPPTLTGAGSKGAFSNNYISLKTLTERLQYGRDIVTQFWDEEIRLVQKAMGFRYPAKVVFDRMVLTDEAAEKQLLISLADRDLISVETLMERFGETPEIEQVRIRREMRKRESGDFPDKASPFHRPEKEHEYTKLFIQQGNLTPSEVGVELEERKPGEETNNDIIYRNKEQLPDDKPVGLPGQGRPPNSRDTKPRKKRKISPRTSAEFFQNFVWAENAQAKIGSLAGEAYLKSLGKKNMRELTEEESKKFEQYKFYLLCQLKPNDVVDQKTIAEFSQKKMRVPKQVLALLKATIAKHIRNTGKEPSLETVRTYQAGVFALWSGKFEQDKEHDDVQDSR